MVITNHTTTTSGQVTLTVRELFQMFETLGASDVPLVDLSFQDIEQILHVLNTSTAKLDSSMGMTIKVPLAITMFQGLPTPVKQNVLVPFLLALRSGDLSTLPDLMTPPHPVAPPAKPEPPPLQTRPEGSMPKILPFAAKTPSAQVCQTS